MSSTRKYPLIKFIDGCTRYPVTSIYTEENFRSALTYQPLPGDVILVTYPKCGTTWLQQILYLIFNDGRPLPADPTFLQQAPYLEFVGAATAQKLKRPAAIKTHLPFDMVPYSKDAKYIYVIRNPKDCCVSYYNHMKIAPQVGFQDGTFEDLVYAFMEGKLPSGEYFDNLKSWYDHRQDPNVLFLTYEHILSSKVASIMNIARFLGHEYYEKLQRDQDMLEKVARYSDFDFMRRQYNHVFNDLFFKKGKNHSDSSTESSFFRKGVVGDWKSFFTPNLEKIFDDWIAERTKESDVMNLWKDLCT